MSHLKGLTPVCTRKCFSKSDLLIHTFPQKRQTFFIKGSFCSEILIASVPYVGFTVCVTCGLPSYLIPMSVNFPPEIQNKTKQLERKIRKIKFNGTVQSTQRPYGGRDHYILTYEIEFVQFSAVLENSVLPMGWDSSHAALIVLSEFQISEAHHLRYLPP